jgi:hypothetical protein
MELPYIRVGTTYYKKVNIPLISGDTLEKLIYWSSECIRQDLGKDVFASIPKYDGFCHMPSHTNYQEVIGKFLNKYEPIPHQPNPGSCIRTIEFLKHIFEEQIELGLDYLTLMYKEPIQILPVLCLVSKERETGKTTFLNWLKAIYQNNMTYNKNEDFRSQFNSDWASKLIIAVDEVLLDKVEDSERIKNLSTARTFKTEAKGKDRIETDFFGKFILCSNNEDSFIQIEPGETRYWVRKVARIPSIKVNLLEELKAEIPAFLHFLSIRELTTKSQTRMWFTSSQIRTEALQKVIRRSRSWLEVEMSEIMLGIMDDFGWDEVDMCINDIIPFLTKAGYRVNRASIKKVLKEIWNITPIHQPIRYKRLAYLQDGSIHQVTAQGRFYKITRASLMEFC